MIFDISNKPRDSFSYRENVIYFNNHSQLLPSMYYKSRMYDDESKNLSTIDSFRVGFTRYAYSEFEHGLAQSSFRTGFISKRNLIFGNNFCYDMTVKKPVFSVMVPRELILDENVKRVTSDECLLYVSSHMSEFTPSFIKSFHNYFASFLGDVVATKNPNHTILGHSLFRPSSMKIVREKILNLIDNEL